MRPLFPLVEETVLSLSEAFMGRHDPGVGSISCAHAWTPGASNGCLIPGQAPISAEASSGAASGETTLEELDLSVTHLPIGHDFLLVQFTHELPQTFLVILEIVYELEHLVFLLGFLGLFLVDAVRGTRLLML